MRSTKKIWHLGSAWGLILVIFAFQTTCVNATRQQQHNIDCSEIVPEDVILLEPKLKNWLNHYQLEINNAYLISIDTLILNRYKDDNLRIFHFTQDADESSIPAMIYSPNNLYYIDLDFGIEKIEGENYYSPLDVDQSVRFIDRVNKSIVELYYTGSSSHIEAVYWINSSVFIACFQPVDNVIAFKVYNIECKRIRSFNIKIDDKHRKDSYYRVFLQELGIKFIH